MIQKYDRNTCLNSVHLYIIICLKSHGATVAAWLCFHSFFPHLLLLCCCVSIQGLHPSKDPAFAVFEGKSHLTTADVVKKISPKDLPLKIAKARSFEGCRDWTETQLACVCVCGHGSCSRRVARLRRINLSSTAFIDLLHRLSTRSLHLIWWPHGAATLCFVCFYLYAHALLFVAF